MDWADAVIAAVLVLSLVRGWSAGALRQLGRVLGRVLGLGLALFYAPALTRGLHPTALRDGAVIALVVLSIPLGGWALYRLAGVAADGISGTVIGVLDRLLGVAVGLLGTLVAVWLVVAVCSVLSWGVVAHQVNRSWFVHALDRVAPTPPAALGEIETLLSSAHLPSVVDGLVLPYLHQVAPSRALPGSVRGTVSVVATGGCSRSNSGVGVVVGPHLVVTSAHVVAGEPRVRVNNESAQIVGFDARNDIAVLRVATSLPGTLGVGDVFSTPVSVMIAAAPTPLAADHWSGVVNSRVTIASRGLYGGARAPRTLLLVSTSRAVGVAQSGSAILAGGELVGLVLEPSPAQNGVVFAAPGTLINRDLALAGSVVSTTRCVG